jgi:hypothetical protein
MKASLIIPRRKDVGFVRSPDDAKKMVSASTSPARESDDDFRIVLTFSLLGLALSLLTIEEVDFIDPVYMANLLLLF